MYEDPQQDASRPTLRWWNRPLPPIVETLVYGIYVLSPFALLMLVHLMALQWIFEGQLRTLEVMEVGIVVTAGALYVWFFTPIFARLDREEGLRARLGSMVYGGPLASFLLLAVMVSDGYFGLTFAAMFGVWMPQLVALIVIPLVAAVVLGVRWMPLFRAVLPVWRERLGQTVAENSVVASAEAETLWRCRVRDATTGLVVLLVLCTPTLVGSTASAIKEVRSSGWTRQVNGGQSAQLSDGSTLEVPQGWSGFVSSASVEDRKIGVLQRLSFDRPEHRFGFGFAVTVVAKGSVQAGRLEASRMITSARKRGDSTFGPEAVDYRGWRGTACAITSSLRKQKDGSKAYYLAMLLEGKDGKLLSVLVEELPEGDFDPARPAAAAKELIDQVELRK